MLQTVLPNLAVTAIGQISTETTQYNAGIDWVGVWGVPGTKISLRIHQNMLCYIQLSHAYPSLASKPSGCATAFPGIPVRLRRRLTALAWTFWQRGCGTLCRDVTGREKQVSGWTEASDRVHWRRIADTATLTHAAATDEDDDDEEEGCGQFARA